MNTRWLTQGDAADRPQVLPSRRQRKKLTGFEKRMGWRYWIAATNIRHMPTHPRVMRRPAPDRQGSLRVNRRSGQRQNLAAKSKLIL